MSTKSNLLRGITNADLKKVVDKALQKGWVLGEMSGTTHMAIVWPPTGKKVTFGTTVRDRNSYKNVGKKIEDASGIEIFPKHRHGRIKHDVQQSGYSNTYRAESTARWSKRINELLDEYENLIIEFKVIASPGDTPRSELNRAYVIIRRMAKIEEFLNELKHPVPKFDPVLHYIQ